VDGGRGGYGGFVGCGGSGGRGRVRIDHVSLNGQYPDFAYVMQYNLTNIVSTKCLLAV